MSASSPDRRRRVFSTVALALSFGVIALTTLGPSGSSGSGWTCIYCGTFALADAILNVLLFVPLGASLRWVRLTATRAVAVGLLTTIAVESAQFLIIPGRDASIGDLVSNTLGCGLGYLIAATANAWLFAGPRQASRISLAYAGLLLGIVCGTAMLLKPSFTDAAYYGDWTPNPGRVLDVSIGSFELPPRRLEHADSVRDAWFAGTPVRIARVAGPKTPTLESLFSIHDEDHREILLVGRDGDDLVFRYRTWAVVARLHQPVLRLPDVLNSFEPGDTIVVHIRRDGQSFCFRVNGNENCGLGFTAGAGWTLLYGTSSFPVERTAFMNAAWLALLFFPIGFWMRSTLVSLAAFFVAALGLVFVPASTILIPTQIHEWAGAGIGIVGGLLFQVAMLFLKDHERAS